MAIAEADEFAVGTAHLPIADRDRVDVVDHDAVEVFQHDTFGRATAPNRPVILEDLSIFEQLRLNVLIRHLLHRDFLLDGHGRDGCG